MHLPADEEFSEANDTTTQSIHGQLRYLVAARGSTREYECIRLPEGQTRRKNIRETDVLHFADDCSRRVQLFELVRLTRANRFWWPMCNRKYHLRGLNVYI